MVKQFKKPDLNAPRFRAKSTRLMNDDFFARFREKHPEFADVTNDQLKQIVHTFNTNLWGQVIENRDGIEMAEGLGYIFMGTCKPAKKLNVDYGKSIKLGARVKARNWESDNHLLKIFYSNYASKYRFEHRDLWQFKACRLFSRAASAAYREEWKKYVEVENNRMISKLFGKAIRTELIEARSEHIPADYNEFQFD